VVGHAAVTHRHVRTSNPRTRREPPRQAIDGFEARRESTWKKGAGAVRWMMQPGGCGAAISRCESPTATRLEHGHGTQGRGGQGTEAVTAQARWQWRVHAGVVVFAVAGTQGDQEHWSSGSGIITHRDTDRSLRVPACKLCGLEDHQPA
jgi:hypothetical protein